MIIDAGNSYEHASDFKLAVSKMNVAPIKYLVVSNYHYDHVFGLEFWRDLVCVANNKTKQVVSQYRSMKYDDASLESSITSGIFSKNAVRNIKATIPKQTGVNL